MYHQEGVQGARNAQHWERTESEADRDIFSDTPKKQQLSGIMSLVSLGTDPLRFNNGLALLKLDVQTAFKSQDPASYLINTKVIKEAAQKIEAQINQITLTEEFLDRDETEQSSIKDELSHRVTFEIQQLTDRVTALPTVHLAGSASLAAKGVDVDSTSTFQSDSLNASRATVASAGTPSPVVVRASEIHTGAVSPKHAAKLTSAVAEVSSNPAASADRPETTTPASVKTGFRPNPAPGVHPASTTPKVDAKKAVGAAASAFTASSTPTQAGASASGAQTPGSKQHIDTVLQNTAGPASAAVRTASTPQEQPKVEPAFPASTPSQTVGSTTSTIPASATSTNQQSSVHLQIAASPISPSSTADHTAPAAGTAPSAALRLQIALESPTLDDPIEEKLLAGQTSHGTTKNFQKMVIDLIIIHRLGALVDPKYLSKDSPLSEKEERSDLELAKKLQKEEFDTYYRNHR